MFLLGFSLGIAFTILIAFLFIVFINRKQKQALKNDEFAKVNVEEDVIADLLSSKKEAIMKNKGVGFNSNFEQIKTGVSELADTIPKLYFPESKYPQYELTIEETLMLNIHVSEKLLDQLNKKRFSLLKELRISQILYMNDIKKNIMEKKFIKKISRYKLVDIIRNGWMVYNIANPLYWVRKIAVTGGLEAALRSFGVTILDIIGEELNGVYSKSFKDAKEQLKNTKFIENSKK